MLIFYFARCRASNLSVVIWNDKVVMMIVILHVLSFSRSNCVHGHIFQIVTRIAIRTVGVLDLTSRVIAGSVFYLQIMKISRKWDVNLTFTAWSFIIVIRELSWITPDPWLQRRNSYTLISSWTIRIYIYFLQQVVGRWIRWNLNREITGIIGTQTW